MMVNEGAGLNSKAREREQSKSLVWCEPEQSLSGSEDRWEPVSGPRERRKARIPGAIISIVRLRSAVGPVRTRATAMEQHSTREASGRLESG
jgi:hypothetical protein